jgi:aspartate/methionine/tyrosine aminotransferase
MSAALADLSGRALNTRPFYVMELMARAHGFRAKGGEVVSMVVGEPDFPTPEPILVAARKHLEGGRIHYTDALGLLSLREAIARDYAHRDQLDIDPARVMVTAGASGALLLCFAAMLNPGDEVLILDPGYPCNREFVSMVNAIPRSLPVSAKTNFQPTLEQIQQAWGPKTRALLLASPANPTGCALDPTMAAKIHDFIASKGGWFVADEIYLRLHFSGGARSFLGLGDRVISINSFSKTYSMTGWRLGWMVAPIDWMPALERLSQNLFISASGLAQQAALEAFHSETFAIVEGYRKRYAEHAAFLLPRLKALGLGIPAQPAGAFYAYCDVSPLVNDSYAFCLELCDTMGVLLAPGRDFSDVDAHKSVRVSFPKPIAVLEEGLDRMERYFLGR